MVTEEEIHDQQLTREEVLDAELEMPQETVEWLPEWDDSPEERPGEQTRIEDETLLWERRGFGVQLESFETTHWRAVISIPESVGEWHPRPIDLQCRPRPEYGFVADVTIEDYVATQATLILAETYQPIWEVNQWIDTLQEEAVEGATYREELSTKLESAADEPENDA